MDEIFNITGIDELTEFLASQSDRDAVRERLFSMFLRYSDYRCAEEWNRAVRLCECLAIVGWGKHEALEACRGVYFNGYPNTFFLNSKRRPRFTDAVWAKRGSGIMIDSRLTAFHASCDDPLRRNDTGSGYGGVYPVCDEIRLQSQRNWISKNPIRIYRTLDNCYRNSRPVVDSLANDLQPMLDERMRPHLYGQAINMICINCVLSFHDNNSCKTNYIIADEHLKLRSRDFYRKLRETMTEEEINSGGYFLRNRYEIGPYRKDTGCIKIKIVFEKEFSDMTHRAQKAGMAGFFLEAVGRVAARQRKKLSYDFDLLTEDMKAILDEWTDMPVRQQEPL